MSDYSHLLGRVLLSVVFIAFGYLQVTNTGAYIANPTVIKVAGLTGVLTPTIIAWLVAAIDLIGGLLILAGFMTRPVVVVLLVFVVLTLVFAHNFWTMEGPARVGNMVNFYKNISIMGGLLLLLSYGPGRFSIDERRSG